MCAALTALALIFSYIEFLIPVSIAVPGIKLGIANIVVVIALYSLGPAYAFFVSVVRVLLAALLFGNAFSAVYSLAGALLSFALMAILSRTDIFSVAGVSMAAGVFHNIGQLIVAAFVISDTRVFYYYPVLMISGLICGLATGVLATLILRRLQALRLEAD